MCIRDRPKFIVADEPISALDVSIRAQVINLLNQLKKEKGFTYMFIAHDLSVVRFISDRIAVMSVSYTHLRAALPITSSSPISLMALWKPINTEPPSLVWRKAGSTMTITAFGRSTSARMSTG